MFNSKEKGFYMFKNHLVFAILFSIFFFVSCNENSTSSKDSDQPGTVTDVDGNVYKTIKIGEQLWMAENLKVTHYRNGEAIPNIMDNTEWSNLSTGAYCVYNNDNSQIETYGLLYNWYTLSDSRNIAPPGWHVPSDEEWTKLENYLGSDAGGKLKEPGTSHWNDPNTGATNSSGFTALPGGYRYHNGSFYRIVYRGYWWSSTSDASHLAWTRRLSSDDTDLDRHSENKQEGFSVRLVSD